MSRHSPQREATRSIHPVHKLARIVLLLATLTVACTSWFCVVNDWPLVDAIYMTVITLSTVGFREVHPLTTGDKVFVVCF